MAGTQDYQLYLTDQAFRLIGHQNFAAESDLQALRVAGAVFRVCHDECHAAEIWRDGARVFRLDGNDGERPFWVTGPSAALADNIEATLARSEWPVARSKRLLAMLARRAARKGS